MKKNKIDLFLQFFAAGKVCTGFSKPYAAKYNASGGVISFTEGRVLARGVNVKVAPDSSDDNGFYADNQLAESDNGVFTGGTLTLTVDGLLTAAERMLMGLPEAGADGWIGYGDNQQVPDVAVGYIARYMSGGVTTYTPTILVKTKFNQLSLSAATQEQEIDWQTQELTARIMRGENANHDWKLIPENDYATEAEAEAALRAKLNITDTYTVTFNSNGGTAVDPQTVTAGGFATEPSPAPTKADATFDGWYADVNLTTPFDFTNTTITADTTIYAKWSTGA